MSDKVTEAVLMSDKVTARISALFVGSEAWESESGITSITFINDDSHGPSPIGNLRTLLADGGKRAIIQVKGLNMLTIEQDPSA